MSTIDDDSRPLRVCDLCGGVDNRPRHVITGRVFPKPGADIVQKVLAGAPAEQQGRLVADLLDTDASDRHMDCCRNAGCPEGVCGPLTAGAEELRGADLLEHLMVGVER